MIWGLKSEVKMPNTWKNDHFEHVSRAKVEIIWMKLESVRKRVIVAAAPMGNCRHVIETRVQNIIRTESIPFSPLNQKNDHWSLSARKILIHQYHCPSASGFSRNVFFNQLNGCPSHFPNTSMRNYKRHNPNLNEVRSSAMEKTKVEIISPAFIEEKDSIPSCKEYNKDDH